MKAIMDNTAFAGVMRLYSSDLLMHKMFLKNYPEHKRIDQQSLADFLTAIVIYDGILLESSSAWNEKELEREGYKPEAPIDGSSASWAQQLLRLLPKDVAYLIKADYLGGPSAISEQDSCRKAFDVMCSPLKEAIALGQVEKIPNVYYAKDYIYRPIFDELNQGSSCVLNADELA